MNENVINLIQKYNKLMKEMKKRVADFNNLLTVDLFIHY
jgi:hypothetical protein